jgi:hypothetical protein
MMMRLTLSGCSKLFSASGPGPVNTVSSPPAAEVPAGRSWSVAVMLCGTSAMLTTCRRQPDYISGTQCSRDMASKQDNATKARSFDPALLTLSPADRGRRPQHLDGDTSTAAGSACRRRCHQRQRLLRCHCGRHSPIALVLREQLLHMVRGYPVCPAALDSHV